MTAISLQFATREDFATLFFQDGEVDCLFVPHVLDVETGASIELELIFQPEWITFRLAVEVLWKRAKGQQRPFLRPGTCVAFPTSELDKLDRLLAFIERQEIEFVQRTAPRVPTALEVRYRSNRVKLHDTARDLSLDGMYLATRQALLIGDRLEVKFRVPGKILPLTLQAEVVRKDEGGVGLRFKFEKDGERDHVKRLVTEAREDTSRPTRLAVGPGESAEGITLTHIKTPTRERRRLPRRFYRHPDLLGSKVVTEKVVGYKSVSQLDLGVQGVWAWRFHNGQKSVMVLWYEDETLPPHRRKTTKIMVRIPFVGKKAVVVRDPDVSGSPLLRTPVDTSNGSILVTLDYRPTVIERLE